VIVPRGDSGPAIELSHASKIYRRFSGRHFATLKSTLLSGSLIRDLRPEETFPALTDVSFTVAAGQTVGIIGRNGSGKSTALKLVAGITKPTSGTVTVHGRISALIELGAGFHPEISGRENVFINGIMLGLTKREIQQRFDEIVEFAELEDFIDAPVKTYSSGMYMRLGFSVAIHVNPDVLLVDEVLAVGDEGFTHRCLDKFGEFKRRGKTILIVTHQLGLVERLCDDVVLLDAGRKLAAGDPKRVIGAYITEVERQEGRFLKTTDARAQQAMPQSGAAPPAPPTSAGSAPADPSTATAGRWGSGVVEISSVAMIDKTGQSVQVVQSGDPLTLRFTVRPRQPVQDIVFGIGIFNAEGVCVYGTNTDIDAVGADSLTGAADVSFLIDALDLVAGTYKVDVAAHKHDGAPYDYHRLLHTLRVQSRINDVGLYRPRHQWQFSANVTIRST
jgi:ABC-type polysaccharide/polyol phosphate transport system ATPase subunit